MNMYDLTNYQNNKASINSYSDLVNKTQLEISAKMKRSSDVLNYDNELQNNKRFKDSNDIIIDKKIDSNSISIKSLNNQICELCNGTFSSLADLKAHNESFHMKTHMWMCSDCKKLFTSKSNLKVHLRVHTRIKPYHCKSCSYSCMHHSSIKEHLSKIHPSVVHSSTNPAYVFNSITVPDPEQFNSASFDRQAFIAGAKEANDKLVAQMSHSYSLLNRKTSSSSTSSINVSPISNSSKSPSISGFLNQHETTNEDESFQSSSLNDEYSNNDEDQARNLKQESNVNLTNSRVTKNKIKTSKRTKKINNEKSKSLNSSSELSDSFRTQNNSQNPSNKYTSFSINSLINNTESNKLSPQSQMDNTKSFVFPGYLNNTVNMWTYANQIQLFYNYINQLNQKQAFMPSTTPNYFLNYNDLKNF